MELTSSLSVNSGHSSASTCETNRAQKQGKGVVISAIQAADESENEQKGQMYMHLMIVQAK